MYCQSTGDVVVNTAILVASPESRMQWGMATSGLISVEEYFDTLDVLEVPQVVGDCRDDCSACSLTLRDNLMALVSTFERTQ